MHRLSHLRISGLGGSVQVWRSEFCSSEQKFPIFANTTLAMILRRRLVTTRRGKIIEILRAAQLLVAFAAGMRIIEGSEPIAELLDFLELRFEDLVDLTIVAAVICNWLTRRSNSVTRAGPGRSGRPQSGFPRLRVTATGIAISPDHTPPWGGSAGGILIW